MDIDLFSPGGMIISSPTMVFNGSKLSYPSEDLKRMFLKVKDVPLCNGNAWKVYIGGFTSCSSAIGKLYGVGTVLVNVST